MNGLITLEKFTNLRASRIADFDGICRMMLAEHETKSITEKARSFAQSRRAGGVYVITSDSQPEFKGRVLEAVVGLPPAEDFFLCLFEPHPVFNTPGELVKAREDLITMLERMYHAAPDTILVPDPARGRKLRLQELGTLQLLDQMKGLLKKDRATVAAALV